MQVPFHPACPRTPSTFLLPHSSCLFCLLCWFLLFWLLQLSPASPELTTSNIICTRTIPHTLDAAWTTSSEIQTLILICLLTFLWGCFTDPRTQSPQPCPASARLRESQCHSPTFSWKNLPSSLQIQEHSKSYGFCLQSWSGVCSLLTIWSTTFVAKATTISCLDDLPQLSNYCFHSRLPPIPSPLKDQNNFLKT